MRSERRLRLQVGFFFSIVAVAFVAVNVVVMLAVWPQVRRLEHIYGALGESMHVIAQMRGVARDLRTTAVTAVLHASQGRAETAAGAPADLAAHLGALSRLEAAFEPIVAEVGAEETWAVIRDGDLPHLATGAARVVEGAGRPGGPSVSVLEELYQRSARVDALFQDLARDVASEVQRGAEDIDGSLRRLLALCAVLLVLGGIGAALLLARALSLIRRYSSATDLRLAELDAFASRVAHDLRTPLQTVSLSLAIIARRSDDEVVRSTAGRAQGGVRRLDGMIADLLEFARSGASPEPGASAEVGAVLEEVRLELQPAAEAAGVRLEASGGEGVRAAASAVAVHAIVANLVENGIKYAREEGERRVAVTAAAEGRHVRIEVRDNGIGIPRDRLSTIFEPFARVRERRDSYGLGLATVRRLVDSHGGAVSVESEEGVGTTFLVELPRVVELAGAAGELRGPDDAASPRGAGS